MARRLSLEGLALFVICTVDALSTYLFLVNGFAHEANPLLRLAVEVSPGFFLLVKLASYLPALVIAEWYRERHPQLVQTALRAAVVVYLMTYSVCVLPQLFG